MGDPAEVTGSVDPGRATIYCKNEMSTESRNSMANTTDNEIALIADIMHFFGLDAPTNITPVKYGISNHHSVVTAQQHVFVVKFLVNQRVETVENDVAIQQALRKRNIGTAAYLRNPKGSIYL